MGSPGTTLKVRPSLAGSAAAWPAHANGGGPSADELRLKVNGCLDRGSVRSFVSSLTSLEKCGPHRLTIDLRRCTFMDVVGACVLLDAARRARRDGRRLRLAGPPSPAVSRMLQLTAVDRVVELDHAMSEAAA